MKFYLSVALPVGVIIHAMFCGLASVDPFNGPSVPFSWWVPWSIVVVASAVAAGAGVVAQVLRVEALNDIRHSRLTDEEAEVVREMRRRTQP